MRNILYACASSRKFINTVMAVAITALVAIMAVSVVWVFDAIPFVAVAVVCAVGFPITLATIGVCFVMLKIADREESKTIHTGGAEQ